MRSGFGKIIHGDRRATLKVKLSSLIIMVRKEIRNLTSLLAGNSPPDLVLNRHCTECEFQARCYKKAKETDDLSLLSGMSKKERLKYRNRGLFSVTQLSYAFRPRRRSKRASNKSVKYDHSLKALAIREKQNTCSSESLVGSSRSICLFRRWKELRMNRLII